MDEQLELYERRLAFVADSWDLKVAWEAGENVVGIDVRSPAACQKEHIPGHFAPGSRRLALRRDCSRNTARFGSRTGGQASILAAELLDTCGAIDVQNQ